VTIAAANFSHNRQKNIDMEDPIKEEYIDGIRYVWLKTPAYHGNGIGRIKNMLSFLRKLYKFEKVINKDLDPDVVIASSTYPLDSYPANWIAKKHKAKFVFELHDLWPMSPMVLSNMSKWHPFIMVMQKAEDYWCKNADLVVSLLPDAYKHLVTRGMSMDKYVVIPNGISPDEWGEDKEEIPKEHKLCIRELKENNKFIVSYVGGHALSCGLDMYLDVADKLLDHQKIHFVFVGQGAEKRRLIERAKSMDLMNVTFLPPVPKKSVPRLLEMMDLLVICGSNTPLSEYGESANKIRDYMMAAKPIIHCSRGDNDIVALSGCGFIFRHGEEDKIANKIIELSNMSKDETSEIGEKGRSYILHKLTYPLLAARFIDELQK
jgi:glycosyltransferase involved in cell wall biosynthesis